MRLEDFKKLPKDPKAEIGEIFVPEGMNRELNRGDMATYYVVIDIKSNGNIEYMPKMEKIE